MLLPGGAGAEAVRWAGEAAAFERTAVEESPYVDFVLGGPLCGELEIA